MPAISTHTEKNHELVSEEVKEIISYRPHWMVRKGNMIFLLILTLLLGSAWFVQYPDVIRGSVRLIAVNAPKLVTAKVEGKLEKLLVTNEQQVQEGEVLAFLQSTAHHQQVLTLREWISSVEQNIVQGNLLILLQKRLPVLSGLGEMQPAYQEFDKVLHETTQVLASGYYLKKRYDLVKDLAFIADLGQNAKKQQELMKEDYKLQEIYFSAKEKLAQEKVIAPLELNQEKGKIINKEQGLEQFNAQIIGNNINEHNKRKELLELQKYVVDQQHSFRLAFLTLKSNVDGWLQQYVLVAPQSGKIIFTSFLQEKQLVTQNQELFYIEPRESRYYAEMLAAQNGLGKMKAGQKVVIRVESYPVEEFGYLTGRVTYISGLPNHQDSFLIKVDLPQGLRTSYNRDIFFRNNLLARGEAITDNRRLFDRFFGSIRGMTRH
jgi:multidrug resistance efflux pump